jgi:hypothetical protein
VLDMQNAYTDGMSRAPGTTELGAGNIGGLTLAPGTYSWSTGVTIPATITLSGGAGDVWIFQIAQNLTVAPGVQVILSGGAQAGNVFWVVAGQTTIGTTAVFKGNILDQTAIVLNTGAQLNGSALAQTAVTLDSNSVTTPSAAAVVTPAPVSTPAPTPTSAPVTVTVTSPTNSGTSVTTVVLTSQQQQQYNQLTALGVSSSVALGAVAQIPAAATPYAPAPTAQIKTIANDLEQTNSGANVIVLQQFLIAQNKGSAAHALAQAGATGYFGALTRAALAEFQAGAGISPAIGNFGPITRSYISAKY